MHRDLGTKPGQISHLDRDSTNDDPENLCFLCLVHHDEYDSTRRQSAGFQPAEVKRYRSELYRALAEFLQEGGAPVPFDLRLSEIAARLVERLVRDSKDGHSFDPMLSLADLPHMLACSPEEAEEAVDELLEGGLVSVDGENPPTHVWPDNRLFWSGDVIFGDNDPIADSKLVARALVESGELGTEVHMLADRLGWLPRRFNPASTYLEFFGLAAGDRALGTAPWEIFRLAPIARTRRFVR